MSDEDIAKLHAKPNSRLNKIDNLQKVCKNGPKKRDVPFGGMPVSSLMGVQYHAF